MKALARKEPTFPKDLIYNKSCLSTSNSLRGALYQRFQSNNPGDILLLRSSLGLWCHEMKRSKHVSTYCDWGQKKPTLGDHRFCFMFPFTNRVFWVPIAIKKICSTHSSTISPTKTRLLEHVHGFFLGIFSLLLDGLGLRQSDRCPKVSSLSKKNLNSLLKWENLFKKKKKTLSVVVRFLGRKRFRLESKGAPEKPKRKLSKKSPSLPVNDLFSVQPLT